MEKNIFIFDKNRCVGCHACLVACFNENGIQEGGSWRKLYDSNPGNSPGAPRFYLSMACNHCDDAPCLKSCPSGAFTYNRQTGSVDHHQELCLGCRFCSWVCPYNAPVFSNVDGTISKCSFCAHRIVDGMTPACAELCPVGALSFTRKIFSAEEAYLSSPVPVKTGSSLEVIELRRSSPPKMNMMLFEKTSPEKKERRNHLTFKEEWPLMLFTLLSTWGLSFYASEKHLNQNFFRVLIPALLVLAGLVSIFHLGKKQRFYMSFLNLSNSWLSREVFFFAAFNILVFTDLFIADLPDLPVIINGILLLISIDFLYKPVKRGRTILHSSMTLSMGLTLWALISGHVWVFLSLMIIRVVAEIFAIISNYNSSLIVRRIIILRFLFLFISLGVAIFVNQVFIVLVLFLIAECLGRWIYYLEISVPGPSIDPKKA